MEALGVEHELAADGLQALEMLKAGAFDAVIADLAMPGMTGLELAERMGELYPDTPVVLTTGWDSGSYEQQASGHPVLTKPFTLSSLEEACEALKRRP